MELILPFNTSCAIHLTYIYDRHIIAYDITALVVNYGISNTIVLDIP